MKNIFLPSLIAILFIVMIAIVSQRPDNAIGSAPTGLATTVSVATTTTVGPQFITGKARRIFTETGNCNSRIITTVGQDIALTFYDPKDAEIGNLSSTTLSMQIGHLQLASTTVVYDSGIYGCGNVYGYAKASTTITLTETK